MTTISITFQKNPLYSEIDSENQPRLFAEVDLASFGIERRVERLPIFYRHLNKPVGAVRVVYTTYIAGLPLETGNLTRMKQVIGDIVRALIRFDRLPEYVFQVGKNAFPIYHLPDQLLTRYPGGLVFSAKNIASLRLQLANHFKKLGRIQNRRDLGLLYLAPFNLQLYEPHCVVRVPSDNTPDIPVFPNPNKGPLNLIAPVNSVSICKPFNTGIGIITIHKAVEKYLIENNQLREYNETTIRKLKVNDWESIQHCLTPISYQITYLRNTDDGKKEITQPVFSIENGLITARINRLGGAVLFFAVNIDNLVKRVGEDLCSYGAIPNPDMVTAISI